MNPHLRDLLLVATPIVVMGVFGNLVGLSTLAGGALINLGYVLAILIGWYVLRRQGSRWWAIGLQRPSRWLTTIAFGEELFYRAFLITRFTDHLGIGSWPAIIGHALLNTLRFGLLYAGAV